MTVSSKTHEAFSFDSFMDKLFWWDDFLGDQLKDEWHRVGTGSAVVVDLQMGGIVRIATGAVTDNVYVIDWNNIRSLHVSKRVTAEFRVKVNQATYLRIDFRLFFDLSNRIWFEINEGLGGATNWLIKCMDGGATTIGDSGVALDTDYHIFRIECHTHGASHVHFYIDDVECNNSPITTNVPDDAGDYLEPYLYIQTHEDVAKSMDIDYVGVRQEI